MRLGIERLEVEEDLFRGREGGLRPRPIPLAARLDGRPDAVAPKPDRDVGDEFRVEQRLAAAEGQAAARVPKQADVLHQVRDERVGGHTPARQKESPGGALRDAGMIVAMRAYFAVENGDRFYPAGAFGPEGNDGAVPASRQASHVAGAGRPPPAQLRSAGLAFGVGAPGASQRASLQEDERAQAVSVARGQGLDVEDRYRGLRHRACSVRSMTWSWTDFCSSTKKALKPATRTIRSR